MPAVANVRVNTQAPFPTLVTGAGPITIAKNFGIWQVGFSMNLVATQIPPSANYPTDFMLGYDSIAGTFFKISLTNLFSAITPPAPIRPQRLVTASPITILGPDSIINVNIVSGSPTCSLPTAASRNGAPLTFKDVGANFVLHPLTITPFAGDTIDGATSLLLNVNRMGVTLVPYNDGVSVGWAIE